MEAQSISNIAADHSKTRKIKIITDEPTLDDALDFNTYSQTLANIITHSTPQFSIGIFGGWGTGKTSLMKMIRKILGANKKIITVWFDAWRYEREENLAVIPFLRTVELSIDETKKDKTGDWELVKKGVKRTLVAFIESSKFSLGTKGIASLEIDGKKVADVLKGDGSVGNDKGKVYYHVTDYLEKALKDLRKEDTDYRIVVFIDDLDRCSPDKALEVLESIKSFFDVEGFVYIIGMDSDTINSLVKRKYGGEESGIKGLYYLQKIVQLPFQIPTWKETDISKSISNIISEGLKGSDFSKDFETSINKELIVKAVELNPRQVKRFINNVILAQSVFNKDIDKLIAVRALEFRNDWQNFLKLITPNDERKKFFEGYKKLKESEKKKLKEITENKGLEEFAKTLPNDESSSFKENFEIYQELIKNDAGKDLINFLDTGAAKILEDIEDMEEYRRALETTEHKPMEGKKHTIEKSELVALLHEGKVEEFNKIRNELAVTRLDFSRADLSCAKLYNANLSRADLSVSRLWYADLSLANLSDAKLIDSVIVIGSKEDVKLIDSVISVGSKEYRGLKCRNADFSNAIIDNQNLVNYLKSRGAVNVPHAIKDKYELLKKLREKGFGGSVLNTVLDLKTNNDGGNPLANADMTTLNSMAKSVLDYEESRKKELLRLKD